MNERPEPVIFPETRFYWDGAKEGRLMLQSCIRCSEPYFPPRPFCPRCGGREVHAFEASGKGRLHSYVISHLKAPGYEPPFTIAVVELEEGPRLMTNIVDCPAETGALDLDMPLEVVFEARGEVSVPQFRPVGGRDR